VIVRRLAKRRGLNGPAGAVNKPTVGCPRVIVVEKDISRVVKSANAQVRIVFERKQRLSWAELGVT
jgi:hypothetical protein